jgi:hypothetical protein
MKNKGPTNHCFQFLFASSSYILIKQKANKMRAMVSRKRTLPKPIVPPSTVALDWTDFCLFEVPAGLGILTLIRGYYSNLVCYC